MRFSALPVLTDQNVRCALVLENHTSCLIRLNSQSSLLTLLGEGRSTMRRRGASPLFRLLVSYFQGLSLCARFELQVRIRDILQWVGASIAAPQRTLPTSILYPSPLAET